MINIKYDINTSTTIVSLNRVLRLAKVYGDIKISDLYLLNTIYALLNTMCLSLTNNQRKKLISAYNTLAFKSNEVCTDVMLKSFQQPMKNRVSQSFVDPDCIVKNKSINYWKASMFSENEEIIEILDRSFLGKQSFNTREVFNTGSNVSKDGIGKICLFINTQPNTDITIKDTLDNDVTTNFTIGYIPTLNGVLIISNLMYNSEQMNLKIIINA